VRVGSQLRLILLVGLDEHVCLVRERYLHLVLRGLQHLRRFPQSDLPLILGLVLVIFELAVLKKLTIPYLLIKPPVLFHEVAS
jgi:hypothetical protein